MEYYIQRQAAFQLSYVEPDDSTLGALLMVSKQLLLHQSPDQPGPNNLATMPTDKFRRASSNDLNHGRDAAKGPTSQGTDVDIAARISTAMRQGESFNSQQGGSGSGGREAGGRCKCCAETSDKVDRLERAIRALTLRLDSGSTLGPSESELKLKSALAHQDNQNAPGPQPGQVSGSKKVIVTNSTLSEPMVRAEGRDRHGNGDPSQASAQGRSGGETQGAYFGVPQAPSQRDGVEESEWAMAGMLASPTRSEHSPITAGTRSSINMRGDLVFGQASAGEGRAWSQQGDKDSQTGRLSVSAREERRRGQSPDVLGGWVGGGQAALAGRAEQRDDSEPAQTSSVNRGEEGGARRPASADSERRGQVLAQSDDGEASHGQDGEPVRSAAAQRQSESSPVSSGGAGAWRARMAAANGRDQSQPSARRGQRRSSSGAEAAEQTEQAESSAAQAERKVASEEKGAGGNVRRALRKAVSFRSEEALQVAQALEASDRRRENLNANGRDQPGGAQDGDSRAGSEIDSLSGRLERGGANGWRAASEGDSLSGRLRGTARLRERVERRRKRAEGRVGAEGGGSSVSAPV